MNSFDNAQKGLADAQDRLKCAIRAEQEAVRWRKSCECDLQAANARVTAEEMKAKLSREPVAA